MREFFKRILGKKTPSGQEVTDSEFEELVAKFESDDGDFSWMHPPATMVNPDVWDRYWQDQFSHGIAGFVHLFCDDGDLVDIMRASGFKTVLCVGNGISQEPRALAWAGFDVTALDLSPFATEMAKSAVPQDEGLSQLIGGRSGGSSGRLEFVVGDLCDPACCPGPYDVVIDRKTLQLYAGADHATAMQAVANRLASPGIFFSHSHDGGWSPRAPREHAAERWFRAQGWQFWQGEPLVTTRVAWLFMTTG